MFTLDEMQVRDGDTAARRPASHVSARFLPISPALIVQDCETVFRLHR